jgi:DNA-directed RNA polymerase beta subunit
LGRIHIRSKLTGVVQDVKIYRTCEIDELSPSLKKIVTKYESGIKKQKSVLTKYKIEGKERLEPDYKLDPTGKLKGTLDGVLIEFYIKAEDMMGVGDKMVYYTAVKGVIKDIMPKGKEPYTDFRDKEPIDTLLTISSLNARMVTSVINVGIVNKILIELDRQCKEKLGIEWKNLEDM